MNVTTYLNRIGAGAPCAPDHRALQILHQAHLRSVPFENLSIGRQEPINLDRKSLFEKIVTRGRGGFCCELNGLFALLLRELGYNVELLSASVRGTNGRYGPEFDHLCLIVYLDRRWLVDVGFGDSFLLPVSIDSATPRQQGNFRYSVTRRGRYRFLRRSTVETPIQTSYRFDLTPRKIEEFQEMCHFHQTSPLSHVTGNRICTLPTQGGRTTISDMRLISTRQGHKEIVVFENQPALNCALKDHFGIQLEGGIA